MQNERHDRCPLNKARALDSRCNSVSWALCQARTPSGRSLDEDRARPRVKATKSSVQASAHPMTGLVRHVVLRESRVWGAWLWSANREKDVMRRSRIRIDYKSSIVYSYTGQCQATVGSRAHRLPVLLLRTTQRVLVPRSRKTKKREAMPRKRNVGAPDKRKPNK